MGRYYFDKKEEADNLKKIYVWSLTKQGLFDGGLRSGIISWTNRWSENKSSISIEANILGSNNYLKLIYTQTDRDTGDNKDFDCKIPITSTPCYLGGQRFWFVCSTFKSGVYCGKRVAVLYKGGDYFACRHCYDLSYESRNENSRYRNDPVLRTLELQFKIDELRKKTKRRTYKGRPTRKQLQINRLEVKELHGMMSLYKKKVLTR